MTCKTFIGGRGAENKSSGNGASVLVGANDNY